MKLSEMLKKIIDDPENLTELPQIIEGVMNLENENVEFEEKVATLHKRNREYLRMIPIPETKTEEKEEEKEEIQSIKELANLMSEGDVE